jgi:hypothetical protein
MRTLSRLLAPSLFTLGLTLVSACGDDGGGGGNNPDASIGTDGSQSNPDAPSNCVRTPGAADRARYVVVARPYNAGGNPSSMYEVVELSAQGRFTRFSPPRLFSLGSRAPFGNIAFTPDGEVGIVPMTNGQLGVFRLDVGGQPTVVAASFEGEFYADSVVMDPSGEFAWVVDANTRENGGGIHKIGIACDGTVTDLGIVAAARSPGGIGFKGTKAVIPARDILDSGNTNNDVHLVDWSANPPTRIAAGDAFTNNDQIFSGFAMSHDGTKAFIGDSNVSGTNRVAVVGISDTAVTPLAVLDNIIDPSAIATSPHGDVAIVSASQPGGQYAEGIYILDAGGANGTWRVRGELSYANGAAVLPGDMAPITRGELAGSVLIAELTNIRRVVFRANGMVDDVDSLTFDSGGDSPADIVGAIGVQP